jgi:hypothetical protein
MGVQPPAEHPDHTDQQLEGPARRGGLVKIGELEVAMALAGDVMAANTRRACAS